MIFTGATSAAGKIAGTPSNAATAAADDGSSSARQYQEKSTGENGTELRSDARARESRFGSATTKS